MPTELRRWRALAWLEWRRSDVTGGLFLALGLLTMVAIAAAQGAVAAAAMAALLRALSSFGEGLTGDTRCDEDMVLVRPVTRSTLFALRWIVDALVVIGCAAICVVAARIGREVFAWARDLSTGRQTPIGTIAVCLALHSGVAWWCLRFRRRLVLGLVWITVMLSFPGLSLLFAHTAAWKVLSDWWTSPAGTLALRIAAAALVVGTALASASLARRRQRRAPATASDDEIGLVARSIDVLAALLSTATIAALLAMTSDGVPIAPASLLLFSMGAWFALGLATREVFERWSAPRTTPAGFASELGLSGKTIRRPLTPAPRTPAAALFRMELRRLFAQGSFLTWLIFPVVFVFMAEANSWNVYAGYADLCQFSAMAGIFLVQLAEAGPRSTHAMASKRLPPVSTEFLLSRPVSRMALARARAVLIHAAVSLPFALALVYEWALYLVAPSAWNRGVRVVLLLVGYLWSSVGALGFVASLASIRDISQRSIPRRLLTFGFLFLLPFLFGPILAKRDAWAMRMIPWTESIARHPWTFFVVAASLLVAVMRNATSRLATMELSR